MIISTLCYIENKDNKREYLMLYRNKKDHDVNEGKWIGVGGKVEADETIEECLTREVREETGLLLIDYMLRGVIIFHATGWPDEKIYVYTAKDYDGLISNCNEGMLRWTNKKDIMKLNLWEGDKIFLDFLINDKPYFDMELWYEGNILTKSLIR